MKYANRTTHDGAMAIARALWYSHLADFCEDPDPDPEYGDLPELGRQMLPDSRNWAEHPWAPHPVYCMQGADTLARLFANHADWNKPGCDIERLCADMMLDVDFDIVGMSSRSKGFDSEYETVLWYLTLEAMGHGVSYWDDHEGSWIYSDQFIQDLGLWGYSLSALLDPGDLRAWATACDAV